MDAEPFLNSLGLGGPLKRGILIAVPAFLVGRGVSSWRDSGALNQKDATIQTLDEQVKDYKDKLSGATPDRRFRLFENLLAVTEHKHALSAPRCTCENVAEDDPLAAASRQHETHVLRTVSIGRADALDGIDQIVSKSRAGHDDHPARRQASMELQLALQAAKA